MSRNRTAGVDDIVESNSGVMSLPQGGYRSTTRCQPHHLHPHEQSRVRQHRFPSNIPHNHGHGVQPLRIQTHGPGRCLAPNGGSMSSSLPDALKPHSGNEVINLAFLDSHNYGSFSSHHNMGAHHMVTQEQGHRRAGTRWNGRVRRRLWASRPTSQQTGTHSPPTRR